VWERLENALKARTKLILQAKLPQESCGKGLQNLQTVGAHYEGKIYIDCTTSTGKLLQGIAELINGWQTLCDTSPKLFLSS